jgi:hypothetical protein
MMGGGGGMGGGGIPPGLAQMFGGGAAGGGGGGNAPSPGARHDRLPPGTRVRLKNLKGGAEHNGKHGLLAEYNDSKGRYVVNMEGEGKNLSLKPANLQQCVPKCEVMGLVSRPDLNGLEGCVLDFDEETGRYLFELPPSHHKDTASFKAANVILPDETRVLICGLSSQGQYNGTMGKVVSYDRPAGRCKCWPPPRDHLWRNSGATFLFYPPSGLPVSRHECHTALVLLQTWCRLELHSTSSSSRST